MSKVWVANAVYKATRTVHVSARDAVEFYVKDLGLPIDTDWEGLGSDRWNSRVLAGQLIEGLLPNGTQLTFKSPNPNCPNGFCRVEFRPAEMP